MSSHWKSLHRGGAAKNKTHFCHCCSCTSDEIVTYNLDDPCDRCRKRNTNKCLHTKVGDKKAVAEAKEAITQIMKEHPEICNVVNSKMYLSSDDLDPASDPCSIHFDTDSNPDLRRIHSQETNNELRLRA